MVDECVKRINEELYESYHRKQKKIASRLTKQAGEISGSLSRAGINARVEIVCDSLADMAFKHLSIPANLDKFEDFYEAFSKLEFEELPQVNAHIKVIIEDPSLRPIIDSINELLQEKPDIPSGHLKDRIREVAEAYQEEINPDLLERVNAQMKNKIYPTEVQIHALAVNIIDLLGKVSQMRWHKVKKKVETIINASILIEEEDLEEIIEIITQAYSSTDIDFDKLFDDIKEKLILCDSSTDLKCIEIEKIIEGSDIPLNMTLRKAEQLKSAIRSHWRFERIDYKDDEHRQMLHLKRKKKKWQKLRVEVMTNGKYVKTRRAEKRGILKDSPEGILSPEARTAINHILTAVKAGANIFEVSFQELLIPEVTVSTPQEKKIETPSTSTYIDYAFRIHPGVAMGMQSVEIDGVKLHPSCILDQIDKETTIYVNSCISRSMKLESLPEDVKAQIRFDPSWYYFTARAVTKRNLRRAVLKIFSQDEINEIGSNYVQRLYNILGEEVVNKTIQELLRKKAEDRDDIDEETLHSQCQELITDIVKGEIDFIEEASKIDNKEIKLLIKLKDEPNALGALSSEFGAENINIAGSQFPYGLTNEEAACITTNQHIICEDSAYHIGCIVLKLPKNPQRRKKYYLSLIKLSNKYPSMSVIQPEISDPSGSC